MKKIYNRNLLYSDMISYSKYMNLIFRAFELKLKKLLVIMTDFNLEPIPKFGRNIASYLYC